MSGKTVLITGAGSGIGSATAVLFAQRDWTVIAGVRSVQRCETLQSALRIAGLSADVREIDVTSDVSVADGIAAATSAHGGIDVVISNAGIGIEGTTEELTLDDFRRSFETNVLGSVRVLQALLPAWRSSGAGRFIAVGSTAGVVGSPFNDAYCASKFALEGLLESLHPVVSSFGISVSVVEPGPVAGDFAYKHGPPPARTTDSPYTQARERFQIVQDGGYATAQANDDIAEHLWTIANVDSPLLRYQTSEDVARLVGLKLKDLDGARVTKMLSRWV